MALEYLDDPAAPSSGKFEYLDDAEKGQSPNAPYKGPLPGIAPPEQVRNEPGLQDVSVPDAMAVQGAAGLAKGAAGLGLRALGRGAGAAMEALPITENIPESIGRIADNQMLKSTGGSMGQIRQIGPEAAREAARVGRASGLGYVFSSELGREKALANLDKTTGQTIGALRQAAGPAPTGMPEKIAAQLAEKYGPGALREGEAGGVDTALNTVKKMGGEGPLNYPSHAGYSKAATELNTYATGNKLYQPTTAATDVANALSRENNAGIAQSIGSDKAAQYVKALSDEQAYKVLEHFFNRGELREMAGRGGGKNILQSFIQGAADKGGYRLTSKIADAIHGVLTNPVDVAGSLGNATQSGVKMTPAALSKFLSSKYANKT